MKAIKFTEKIVVDKDIQVVFDYTQDYNHRLSWDTFLQKAVLVNGATKAGKGVKSYCVARNGLGMETEYVSFNRPKVAAVKMTKGPFLFTSFSGSWNFKDLGTDKTEVLFLYAFTLRFPFSIARLFIKYHLQKNVRQRLTDLKTCMEIPVMV